MPSRRATSQLSRDPLQEGRLSARPKASVRATAPGFYDLGLARTRDAVLFIPSGHREAHPAPLAVMLHGAGGNAQHGMSLVEALAEAAGMIVLAPPSRAETWDVIRGGYGPDVSFIDEALEATFERCSVDPLRLSIGGFSDGASYSLSMGLTNGDLFTHVIAFSPGFMAPADQVGAPRIFVSHGTRDSVLPIDSCSRRLVPALESAGYDVQYREFDGPHTIPPSIAREAVDWMVAPAR